MKAKILDSSIFPSLPPWKGSISHSKWRIFVGSCVCCRFTVSQGDDVSFPVLETRKLNPGHREVKLAPRGLTTLQAEKAKLNLIF